ncbi:hypothetical protein QC764_507865 [Podospora pseudoanserina]|uniref:Lysine-specific metallo-endopeptidase domain-containing protein n=1 Tax=Podospora pseudoanserina TaxID=2609844 RepID=A0ABR0I6I8_9PEZI|nr:hypothetical protein QC764_507865 [Podospora pseudoanserina]
MHLIRTLFLASSLSLAHASVLPSTPKPGIRALSKRAEPNTGEDFPEDEEPVPNRLNKVETAFKDAIELTSAVLSFIETDETIYPHYFDPADREEITRIFRDLNNDGEGHDMLGNFLVQTTDLDNACGDRGLAYSGDYNTEQPFIVVCPRAFNKKAIGDLEGKDRGDEDARDFYAACAEDGGDIADNVSFHFNTLGMTLLHEYLHYDLMIQSSFGSIVDNPDDKPGYGPVAVYDRLPKDLARVNADSYAYYAAEVYWSLICQKEFQGPREGIDDADPDCGEQTCET